MSLSKFILFSLVVLGFGDVHAGILERGVHCVAYKAHKTMFLFSSGEVIGRNCDISGQVLPEIGGLYHVEVTIPVRSFQSGDKARDADVMKALRSDVKSDLIFKSQAKTAEEWRRLLANKDFTVTGQLTIGDKTYPVQFASQYVLHDSKSEVLGRPTVRFADFEIDPPRVGGGLVAKTKPEFELYFNLLGGRILGSDSVKPEEGKAVSQ